MRIPPHAKYEIIYEMTKQNGNRLSVSTLCEIAGVSRSGYYNYLSTEDVRLKREEQDRKDFQKILEAYSFRGCNKGARSIYMRLLHMDPPIHMNVKKIRRLMKKYGLFCPIRKANPYRRMAKAMATNNIAPNLVNREFEKHGPRKILLTDITYIINGKAPRVYMSTIIDAYTKEILSWVLSDSLVLDFVLDTVTQLCYTHDISLTEETIISVVPKSKVKIVAKMLKAIHAQESKEAARKKARDVAEKLRSMRLNEAAKKVEDGIEETLTYMDFPSQHWLKIRTNNVIERMNREIRRRTRVVGTFPDGKSALMLVCARLRYVSGKEWGSKRYLCMKYLTEAATEVA